MDTKEMFKVYYIAHGKTAAIVKYKELFLATCLDSIEFIQKLEEDYPEIVNYPSLKARAS